MKAPETYNAARRACEAAEATLVCFELDGIAYSCETEICENWVKWEHAATSKGGKMKARIKLDAKTKHALKNRRSCLVLGTMAEVNAIYAAAYEAAKGKPAPKNSGWAFEAFITEKLARQTWEPDSVPFWKGPDVVIHGISYQIKASGATYYTENGLQTAMRETGR